MFKFPGSKDKVSGCDLVTEGFTNLGNPEGHFFAGRSLNILKIDKNPLGGFRSQEDFAGGIFINALEGFKHQIKLADIGVIHLPAFRTDNLIFFDESLHFFIGPGINNDILTLFKIVVSNQFISPETGLTGFTIHQWIVKATDMTRGDPGFGVHQDRRIETDIIGGLLNKFFPPGFFYVVFHFDTQRAVIPTVSKTIVYFGTGEDNSPHFGKTDNFSHRKF